MNPADLGFTLTAQLTRTIRAVKYCVYGDMYQLTCLYFEAYEDHTVIYGSSMTLVEDWEKKYFA